jgi:hypothetical protein
MQEYILDVFLRASAMTTFFRLRVFTTGTSIHAVCAVSNPTPDTLITILTHAKNKDT